MTTASQKVGNYGFLTVSAPGNGTAPMTYSFRSSNGAVNGGINNATAADLGSYTQAPYSGDRTQTILRFANGSQVIVPNGDVQSFTLALVQAVPPVNGKLFDTAVTAGVDKTVTTPAVSTTKPAATTATSTPAPAPTPKPVSKTAAATVPAPTPTTTPKPVPKLTPPAASASATANVVPNISATVPGPGGITAQKADAQQTPYIQDQTNAVAQKDWRVRVALSSSKSVTYLYNDPDNALLKPLHNTSGVIFPYTPTITVNYTAQYDPTTLVHSNYKVFQYGSSAVDSVSISGDFTAQDVHEANYMLAVIHFFRTMTKMFYGQDTNPKPGTPPPLCYLYGLGEYQFAGQPMAIQGFTYTTPLDVDYIATTGPAPTGATQKNINPNANSNSRIGSGTPLAVGGVAQPTKWPSTPVSAGKGATYVPTRINMSVTCVPMMSRNQVSNKFSLKDYANGTLLKGTQNSTGAFW